MEGAYNAGIGELCDLFLPGGQSVIKGGNHDLPRLRPCTKGIEKDRRLAQNRPQFRRSIGAVGGHGNFAMTSL